MVTISFRQNSGSVVKVSLLSVLQINDNYNYTLSKVSYEKLRLSIIRPLLGSFSRPMSLSGGLYVYGVAGSDFNESSLPPQDLLRSPKMSSCTSCCASASKINLAACPRIDSSSFMPEEFAFSV